MSKTTDLRQLGNALPDRWVATARGANHEDDRASMGVSEDFFDGVLKFRDHVEGGKEITEDEKSVAMVRVGFPICFLRRVDGVGIPLAPILVEILVTLTAQVDFELFAFPGRRKITEVRKPAGHGEDGAGRACDAKAFGDKGTDAVHIAVDACDFRRLLPMRGRCGSSVIF